MLESWRLWSQLDAGCPPRGRDIPVNAQISRELTIATRASHGLVSSLSTRQSTMGGTASAGKRMAFRTRVSRRQPPRKSLGRRLDSLAFVVPGTLSADVSVPLCTLPSVAQ